MFGRLKKPDFNYLPNKSIAFTTQEIIQNSDSPHVTTLNSIIPGTRSAYVVHPNLCFGYNPTENLNLGFVHFNRHTYTHCN